VRAVVWFGVYAALFASGADEPLSVAPPALPRRERFAEQYSGKAAAGKTEVGDSMPLTDLKEVQRIRIGETAHCLREMLNDRSRTT
jgi:hypothetical protein